MADRINHYDIGDLWVPQATFTVGGVNTDPTNLTVRQQAPDGTETVVASSVLVSGLTSVTTPVAKTATGVFKLNPGISLTSSGYWFVRFEGAGAVLATEEQQAVADPSEFTSNGGLDTRALVTLAETKDWLQVEQVDTSKDLELVRVINDVSDRMHYEAGREFKPISAASAARSFEVDTVGWRTGTVMVGDLSAAPTLVEIIDTDAATVLETVSAANYTLNPLVREAWEPVRRIEFNYRNGVTYLRPGMRVRVTGVWGFPAVPGNVRQATLDAIAAVIDRDVEHYRQDLGFNQAAQGGGTVIMVGGGRQRFTSMPSTSLAVAWSYRDQQVG